MSRYVPVGGCGEDEHVGSERRGPGNEGPLDSPGDTDGPVPARDHTGLDQRDSEDQHALPGRRGEDEHQGESRPAASSRTSPSVPPAYCSSLVPAAARAAAQ